MSVVNFVRLNRLNRLNFLNVMPRANEQRSDGNSWLAT